MQKNCVSHAKKFLSVNVRSMTKQRAAIAKNSPEETQNNIALKSSLFASLTCKVQLKAAYTRLWDSFKSCQECDFFSLVAPYMMPPSQPNIYLIHTHSYTHYIHIYLIHTYTYVCTYIFMCVYVHTRAHTHMCFRCRHHSHILSTWLKKGKGFTFFCKPVLAQSRRHWHVQEMLMSY